MYAFIIILVMIATLVILFLAYKYLAMFRALKHQRQVNQSLINRYELLMQTAALSAVLVQTRQDAETKGQAAEPVQLEPEPVQDVDLFNEVDQEPDQGPEPDQATGADGVVTETAPVLDAEITKKKRKSKKKTSRSVKK